MQNRKFLVLAWMLLGVVVLVDGHAEMSLVFSGEWIWDAEKNQDFHKLLSANLDRLNQTGMRRSHAASASVTQGKHMEKPAAEKAQTVYEYLDSVVPLQPIVKIHYAEPLLRLTYKDGRRREVFTDERDSSAVVQSAIVMQDQKLVLASIDKETGKIVIETNSNSGTTIIETLSVDRNPKSATEQLQYAFSIESVRLPKAQKLTYVYHRPIKPSASQ